LENRFKDTVEGFDKITGFGLEGLLFRFNNFATLSYPKIVSYYSGQSEIDSKPFNELDQLISDFEDLTNVFESQEGAFANMRYWDLMSDISGMKTFLATSKNSNRWLRSSVVNASYGSFTTEDRSLKKNETIEDIERLDRGTSNPQNSWVNTAIKNNAKEEDLVMGKILSIDLTGGVNSFEVTNAVDSISGKSLYGKDIKSTITFADNDLESLDFEETMKQTVVILLGLTKGKNYFYPTIGISKTNMGIDRANFSFPSLFRELSEAIASDDSIKGFEITNIRHDQDAIFYDVKITTALDKYLNNEIKLT
jgi:hypothetical protein